MKTIFTYGMLALALIAGTGQLMAQVNGTAARPVVSTVEKPVYYYIESAWDGTPSLNNTSVDARGHLMYAPTSTSGVQLKHNFKATITSTLSEDNAIWQIISENGVVKMKNKGTGLYLNESKFATSTPSLSATFSSIVAAPTQFTIKNNATSAIVAWTNTNCDRLTSQYWGANGPAAWYFIVLPGSEANYQEFYMLSIKNELAAKIAQAQTMYNATTQGAGFGQYPQSARQDLAASFASAQAVHDNVASTEQELVDATLAVLTAVNTYRTFIVSDPELLTDTQNYRWYWIRSTTVNAYAAGKVISSTGRLTGSKFTFEAKASEPVDEQLFRFELTDDKLKVKNIINKTGKFMAANGAVSDTAVVANTFSLVPLNDGLSFNIKPASVAAIHAQESGTHIVNWAGDGGSASAWVFDLALETPKVLTSVPEMEKNYRIQVLNGRISVEGVDSFEVYSVTGQRQPLNVSLQQGVYIVKTSAFTAKVMVR